MPPLLTFLGSCWFWPEFVVFLAGDLGEGEEAEEQAGSPECHSAAVRPSVCRRVESVLRQTAEHRLGSEKALPESRTLSPGQRQPPGPGGGSGGPGQG